VGGYPFPSRNMCTRARLHERTLHTSAFERRRQTTIRKGGGARKKGKVKTGSGGEPGKNHSKAKKRTGKRWRLKRDLNRKGRTVTWAKTL